MSGSCRIQRWGWRDGPGGAWARAAHHLSASQEGKPFSFRPKPSHYPTRRNADLPFPFCTLCMNLGLLQRGSSEKKKKKKKLFQTCFLGCFLFLLFSAEAKWHEAKAALAAACCLPGWQGHLVGRATCAGEGREKHTPLTSHQGQYFIFWVMPVPSWRSCDPWELTRSWEEFTAEPPSRSGGCSVRRWAEQHYPNCCEREMLPARL